MPQMSVWMIVASIIAVLVFLLIGFVLGVMYRKKVSEREIASAEDEAKRIINEGIKAAENKKREALLEAKEEIHRTRTECDREVKERRNEVSKQERRLQQKEENLDRKTEALEKKTETLNRKLQEADAQQEEIKLIKKSQLDMLEKISGYSVEEAKQYLIKSVEADCTHEMAAKVKEVEAQFKDEAEQRAREVIATAIQRCAADHTSEITVSVVPLPNDEMKGRIIGREGRNIRSIETLTGCDLIIDDTPEAITVSSFDPVRREVARLALEKLIQDGRIHPARIEEMVAKAQREVNADHQGRGRTRRVRDERPRPAPRARQAPRPPCATARATARTCSTTPSRSPRSRGLLAAELGVDVALAKRAGLLHDLGKSIDHEVEGSHVTIGVDLARKYKESDEVIHAIEAHHGDVEPHTVIACIVQAADAISAARPGARRENIENYVKRLEKLEEVSRSLPRHCELLCHSGRPRDPRHGQARRGQRGSDRPARARHRQEDRSRAYVPRPDQGPRPARDQGRRLREIRYVIEKLLLR